MIPRSLRRDRTQEDRLTRSKWMRGVAIFPTGELSIVMRDQRCQPI
jgi:hypothetical protein